MLDIEIQYREIGKNVWIDKIIYKNNTEEMENNIEFHTIYFYRNGDDCLRGIIHKRTSNYIELENLYCRLDNFFNTLFSPWGLEIKIERYYSKRYFKRWIRLYKKIQSIMLEYEKQDKYKENSKIQTISMKL